MVICGHTARGRIRITFIFKRTSIRSPKMLFIQFGKQFWQRRSVLLNHSLSKRFCISVISQEACREELVRWTFAALGSVLLHPLSETLPPHTLDTLGTLSPWQLLRTSREERWEKKCIPLNNIAHFLIQSLSQTHTFIPDLDGACRMGRLSKGACFWPWAVAPPTQLCILALKPLSLFVSFYI